MNVAIRTSFYADIAADNKTQYYGRVIRFH